MGANTVQKTEVTTLQGYIHLNYQWFKFFNFQVLSHVEHDFQ